MHLMIHIKHQADIVHSKLNTFSVVVTILSIHYNIALHWYIYLSLSIYLYWYKWLSNVDSVLNWEEIHVNCIHFYTAYGLINIA